jgi:hypothetical protein
MIETEARKSPARTLSLRMQIDAGDPIGGCIEIDGAAEPIAFSGWVELMAAIHNARAGAAI